VIRLVAYLVGVAAMGTIAQSTVGSALHDTVWSTRERTLAGETRVVTQTSPLPGETTTQTGAPGQIAPARTTTIFVTEPGRTTTTTTITTVAGPAVTSASATTETVSAPGPTITTTVPGPTATTTTTVPGPTTTTTVPGPMRTTTVPGAAVTTTVPGPTVTVTETETVTVKEDCDPPPKRPTNPPCPPHK
jgi:hypothetical protein